MKHLLLLCFTVSLSFFASSQNINDNKVTFNYIQLPLIQIAPEFENYHVNVVHAYLQANEDSLNLNNARKQMAMTTFLSQMARYNAQRDSLNHVHLTNLSAWEKKVNAGVKNADGSELARPAPPMYPAPPEFAVVEPLTLHSDYANEAVEQRVALAGYEQGAGEVEITITLLPIRNIRFAMEKKGTGSATKYHYTAYYTQPIGVKVASPSQGILLETELEQYERSYKMREQSSQYDHELYMMDNREVFFKELESYARANAIAAASDYINDQCGFVVKNRIAELYSVKSYKNYDYSDVTSAFSKTVTALQSVSNDHDRASAQTKIQDAINAIKGILEESDLNENKSRINSKVTAMLQCNLAELYIWQADFDKADATMVLIQNCSEGKARRHVDDEIGFCKDQRARWKANY